MKGESIVYLYIKYKTELPTTIKPVLLSCANAVDTHKATKTIEME
jgi:hypothetical protein